MITRTIEYKKAMHFLEISCKCGCTKKGVRKNFAELREVFQALSRSEQDNLLPLTLGRFF
jgi:hypothetical protein